LDVGPFLSVRVTGPVAPLHVMLKGEPAVIPAKVESVNWTWALTPKKAAAAKMTVEKRMIAGTVDSGFRGIDYKLRERS